MYDGLVYKRRAENFSIFVKVFVNALIFLNYTHVVVLLEMLNRKVMMITKQLQDKSSQFFVALVIMVAMVW
ncbi:MAG: hypothetical protein B7C24_16120 [Bacteroidetes bacterium 4572_77]|nr:MAG: hypothetical protein B7C24_16120 [Bacteroidetes bacterium 4572_77]